MKADEAAAALAVCVPFRGEQVAVGDGVVPVAVKRDVIDAADAAAAVLSAGNLVENGGFETAAVPLDGAEQLPPAHIVRSAVPHGLSGLFLKAHEFPSVFCSSDHIFCSEQGSTRIRPRGHGIPSHNTHGMEETAWHPQYDPVSCAPGAQARRRRHCILSAFPFRALPAHGAQDTGLPAAL